MRCLHASHTPAFRHFRHSVTRHGRGAYNFLASSRAVKNTHPPMPIHSTRGSQPCACPASGEPVHGNWTVSQAQKRTFRKAAAPSSLAILVAQSTMDAYRPLTPCVIIRVLMTSRGVVKTPVTAPASAPTTDVSAALSSVREPRNDACAAVCACQGERYALNLVTDLFPSSCSVVLIARQQQPHAQGSPASSRWQIDKSGVCGQHHQCKGMLSQDRLAMTHTTRATARVAVAQGQSPHFV